MIRFQEFSYGFPQKMLYNKISFTLDNGNHCGFIGASGSGKSTLVDILMNPEPYMFEGVLEIDPSCRIGLITQFPQVDTAGTTTVFQYIAEKFISYQDKITALCAAMETAADIDPLLEEYQQVLDAFDAIGGANYENLINKKLNMAGLLKRKDLKVSELSGGEFKLIQVIKEMLTSPDLLIMDEPDVFLDFENLNSLRKLLNSHKGTLLVITHNRFLLNHCFNKIIHLENMALQEFDGRYYDYNFALLQGKIELQELAVADSEEIERNNRLIHQLRDRASSDAEAARGRALKSRVKIQERLEARRVKAPFVEIPEPDIHFTATHPLEDTAALTVTNYRLAFDEVLLENVSFELNCNDKVALIGANGTGKTSLLRDIYNNSNIAVKTHPDVSIGYLSQHQSEVLTASNTILEEFFEAGFKSAQEVGSYVSGFGFDSEALNQLIGVLSGGEKNILQLAKAAATGANLLLLDEPTSHLDTYSQIALEKAIADYNGAILMVSHDYYTIINCMDYVLLIEGKNLRKITMRKFKKMIYAHHFTRDYLEIEQKKKTVETQIQLALRDTNFELAKNLSVQLEELIKLL